VKRKKFDELYTAYSDKLYNYALWLTRNKDACNDILQNVFIKLWKQDTSLYWNDGLEAWLYKVTRNACLDFFRKCSRFTRFRLKYAKENSFLKTESNEQKAVWDRLDILNEKERSILYLHFHTGHSFKEIAKILHIKETAVRVTSFRALRKLRKKCAKDIL
jgi:RNA polymerase sigma-70 factor (ECF subfamily)